MNGVDSFRVFNNTLDTYESADLSYTLIKDTNYQLVDFEVPKSFYRADFRGSKIVDCKFMQNPFGRADFVDSFIFKSDFKEVNWGSCLFKNAYIEQCFFKRNEYKGISSQFTQYVKCTFCEENIVTNMYKSIFNNCHFINCIFERSSLEELTFINCIFENTEIAQCHAENLYFDSCNLNTVSLGAAYWATYLFKNTSITECNFLYKGAYIEISDDNYLQNYIKSLLAQKRLYELFNIHILFPKLNRGELVEILNKCFEVSQDLPIYIRQKNITNILSALNFYFNYNHIDFLAYQKIVSYLQCYNWGVFTFEEQCNYISLLARINMQCKGWNYSLNYFETISPEEQLECEIRINESDERIAIKYIGDILILINNDIYNNLYKGELFIINKVATGSIILNITSFALLLVFLSYALKTITHNIEEIKIEKCLGKKIRDEITDAKLTPKKAEQIIDLTKKSGMLSSQKLNYKKTLKLSSEIMKGEILDFILRI